MSKNTKNTFIIASITFLVSVSACLFFTFEIKSQGLHLEEKVKILAEYNDKEIAYLNVSKIIKEAEGDRAQIASKFFKNENDYILFLNEIETLAPNMGLVLKTSAIEDVLDDEKKPKFAKITFSYKGQKKSVMDFSRMLENISYYSYIETLSLKEGSEGWEGEATILISVQPS